MRVLVYKRTHVGDPDAAGRFGVHDCMGRDRWWNYDAVVGVGGVGKEPEDHRIAGKVTWVGIGPHKEEVGKRGPLVTFDRFALFDAEGPEFVELAPKLAARIYAEHIRATIVDGSEPEMLRVLALATNTPPPGGTSGASRNGACSTLRQRDRRPGGSCT
jgi:hypothetical protein